MPRLLYFAGFGCALGLATSLPAAEAGAVSEAIRAGLPKYDPRARDRPPEPPKQINSRSAKSKAAPPPAPSKPEENILTLPELVVRPEAGGTAAPSPPTKPLPRLTVPHAPGKDAPAEPFETPAARDERLVKKHLSRFDRFFLNRYTPLGATKEARAKQAEAVEQNARQLNEFAEALERRTQGKKETVEDRKLRELYYNIYLNRPR